MYVQCSEFLNTVIWIMVVKLSAMKFMNSLHLMLTSPFSFPISLSYFHEPAYIYLRKFLWALIKSMTRSICDVNLWGFGEKHITSFIVFCLILGFGYFKHPTFLYSCAMRGSYIYGIKVISVCYRAPLWFSSYHAKKHTYLSGPDLTSKPSGNGGM